MVGTTRTSHGRVYHTYSCPNHKKGDCPTKEINTDILDWFVATLVVKGLLKEDSIPRLISVVNQMTDEESLKKLRDREATIQRKAEHLSQTLAHTQSETLREQLMLAEDKKKAIQREIESLKKSRMEINKKNRKKLKTELRKFIITDDSPETREFLKAMLREVRVDNDNVCVELKIA